MFCLRTLGGLSLGNSGASDVAIPRRRLALLALLAAAGNRGLSRDKLVSYFWPEGSPEDARHSLEQLLYSVRHQVHGSVFRGTDPVCLDPDVITSDVAAFEDALARGADNEAVRHYTGDFLDGVYLNNTGEFERWVDEQRSRLRTAYGSALGRIAEHAAQRNDWSEAVAAWRSLVALDRLSTRSVLGLVRALAGAGDHAEALRTATTFETLVREDLGLPLDPSLSGFLQELRRGRNIESGTPAVEQRRPVAEPPHELAGSTTDTWPPLPPYPAMTAARPLARRRVVAAVLLIAGPVIVVAMWLALPWRVTRRPRVSVAVFQNWTRDTSLDYVGTMSADYTRIALAQTGMLDVDYPSFDFWDPRNAGPGRASISNALVWHRSAGILISGAYYKKGDALTFTGRGVETTSGSILFAFDSVTGKELEDVMDRVRQRVMSGIATHVDTTLRAWAGNQGKPPMKFAAYREFAAGMTAFVSGIVEQKESTRGTIGFASAREHLGQAFRLDSTYYIAALWWFWSRYNTGDRPGADSVLGILASRSKAMTPYERALYDYEVALMHGTPERRYQLDKQLVGFAPASEFRYCLARDAVQASHPQEALDVLESLDDTYSWIKLIQPAPGFRVRALVQLGEHKRAIAAAAQIHEDSPDDLTSDFPEIDALSALDRVDEVEDVVKRATDRAGPLASSLPNLLLYAGLRLQAADRTERAEKLFASALALYSGGPTTSAERDPMVFGRGRSLYYLGKWNEAREAFEQLTNRPLGTAPYDWRALTFLGSLAARRNDSVEVERIRSLLDTPAVNPADLQYLEARIAAVRGDSDRAVRFLADAVKRGAHVWQVMDEGDAAPSMDPDFARLRGSREFRRAAGFW
jgi:DNA-binding SARP family transcriptional activator